MEIFNKYKQPFFIQQWSHNGSKENLYIFRGKTHDEKEDYSKISNSNNIVLIDESIYVTDTIESLHYKIAKFCLQSKNIQDIYFWTNVPVSDEDIEIFVQNLYKNELKLKKSYINTITKAYLNKNIYSENLEEYIFKEDLTKDLKINSINKSLNFEFKDINDYGVFVSPNPFINLNESTAKTVVKTSNKSLLMKFNSTTINFTIKNSLLDPIYFKNNLSYDPQFDKMNNKKMEIQDNFMKNNEFINDLLHRIEIFAFRVLPYSHDIELDLSIIFKMSRTSYNIPIIVYKSKYTNMYKVNKLALHDMDTKQVNLFEEKELKHRDTTFNRSSEVLIYYIKLVDNIFFYLLLNTNGSYKIKYTIINSIVISIEDIKKSFTKLKPIFDSIDNNQMLNIDESTDIFNSEMIEIIDFNTNNVVTFNSKIDSKRFFDTIENNPFFGNKKSEKDTIKSFQFIETNNFINIDNITNFLYINAELDKHELIDKMQHFFKISEEKASELFEEHRKKMHIPITRKGKNVFAIRQYHTAVNIKMNIMSNHSVRIYTTNTQDMRYQWVILYYITQFLTQNIKLKKFEKELEKTDSFNKSEVSFNDLQEWDEQINDDIDIDNILDDIDIPIVNNEIDIEDYDDIINDEMINNEITHDDISENVNKNNNIDIDIKDINKKIEKTDYTTFVLMKLYAADRKLFQWKGKTTKLNNYSSKCGNVDYRQPIVINKAEKDNIDKNHPGSYTGFVKTGSTEELINKNYYICPKIWCRFSRVSITEEEYKQNNNKCPPPYNEEAMFFPPKDAKKNYFLNKNNIESHYPSLLEENKHPESLRLPCCGIKPFKEDIDNKKKKVANYISNIDSDMKLNKNQNGNLPVVLNLLLNQQASCFGQLNSKSTCFVRTGNENIKNPLLSIISKVFDTDVIDLILNTMTIEDFIFLNSGNMLKRFIDNEKQFEILDVNNYKIFKTYFVKNTNYIKHFNLNKELEYISKNDSFNFEASTMKDTNISMSIIREYLIFQSFVNFKNYISNNDIEKHLDDIQHLLTYKWLNKENYNFIFLENINDEVYFMNPKYYNIGDYFNTSNMNILIYKIKSHYELISFISQKSKSLLKEILIPTTKIKAIIDQVTIIKSKYFEKVYGNPKIKQYLLSYGFKCIGIIDNNGIEIFEHEVKLRYDNIKNKNFIYIDNLESKYKKQDNVKELIDEEEINLELFVNNFITNQNEESIKELEYFTEIYNIAKTINSKKKIKNSLDVLNHSISNFSNTEKVFLLNKILTQNKISIKDTVDKDRLFHDLIQLPLKYILGMYRLKTLKPDKNEIQLSYENIVERKLSHYRNNIILNKYQIFEKSSDDLVNEISHIKIETDNTELNDNKIHWTLNRVPLKPVTLSKIFPTFEAIDEEINLNRLVNLFNSLNETFNLNIFRSQLNDRIATEYNKNKENLLNIYKINPSSTIHKIGKKSNINDFVKLIDTPDYSYSFFELEVIAKLVEFNVVIMGRDTSYMNNGIKFINNKSNNYIFFLYSINKDKHSFRLITTKDEVKYAFHTDNLTIEQINLLNLS